jgi:protein-tyrosine phosphatase
MSSTSTLGPCSDVTATPASPLGRGYSSDHAMIPGGRDRLPAWHVDVDGCVNFRDVGGWTTVDGKSFRTGRLYRSDDPIRITPAGRAAVDRLGLAMVIDLRQQSQFSRTPGFVDSSRTAHVPLVDQVVDPVNPPPLDTPSDIADLYVGMLEESREQVGRVLDLVADTLSTGPVLVHCAFGKDRAGLITALVHAAVGVRREDIVADYVRSDAPAHRRRTAMLATPLPDDPPIGRLPEALFRATAATIELFLAHVLDQFGSLDAWVASFPTAPSTVARLRAELVHR